MIDYLIIGSGLAGIAFAETALQNNKSVFVIDADLHHSSKVAAGLYNPVVLKRYNAVANANHYLDVMGNFYDKLEDKLHTQFNYKLPLLRKFNSIEEQNNWFVAADKAAMRDFLSTDLVHREFSGIESPFGLGKVNRTGYVDTVKLLDAYKNWLTQNDLLAQAAFDYDQLQIESGCIRYQGITAKQIVFAEGFGVHANPFFKDLPLDGTKGELLLIKAPRLNLDVLLNANLFVLPIDEDVFKVGATYNWDDKTEIPTEAAKQELIERLKEVITCEFELIDHQAGVRPTVKDRKPLIGTHAGSNRIHILNGLGTRGVMLAPAMAKMLFENIENNKPLPSEIDIQRFCKKD
jgi:glycine oxidase